MELAGTAVSLFITLSFFLAFFYTVVRWYWNGDERLNSEWFN